MSASTEIEQVGDESSTAKKINNLLNSPKTRFEGLQLLNLFLPQCPKGDFIQFCVSWMQNCCKTDGLKKKCNYSSHLLRNLIETSSKYPELKKSVSFFITTRYFDFFFKHLLNSQGGWLCTEACLLLYRGACGQFQESLEKHLKIEIEKNVTLSSTIGRCFALFPCTGGGGNDGVNYKNNWKTQFLKFLSICHSILNDLFSEVEELEEYDTHGHVHNRNKKEKSMNYLAIQFSNYCSVLSFMLLNQYPAPKTILPDQIFQLICRGLAPNLRAMAKRQTTDAMSLQKVLPEIYYALFSLLKAVIVTCKSQLLPYSQLICKLIKQGLEYDFADMNEKQFKNLRVTTYGVLCDWLAVARNGSCLEVISSTVVSCAVNDIRPKQEVVSLKESKLQVRSKSKEQTTRRINPTATSKLCHSALMALQFLLKFSGVFLNPEVHKFLQEVVVKLLVELQKSSNLELPFSLPSCRKELYSLLLELTLQPCLKWPPPTNFALRLFSNGLNDTSLEVSSFCSTALNVAAIIIHPQYDNGRFLISSSPDNNNRMEEFQSTEELMEVDNEKEIEILQEITQEVEENSEDKEKIEENSALDFQQTTPTNKVRDIHQESEISSDEDSRNTETFIKDSNEAMDESETKSEELLVVEEETITKELRSSSETPQKSPSTEKPSTVRGTPESNKITKTEISRLQDSDGSKSVSPESTNEDGHNKGRYFLRSKTKASSEEPEEAQKRTNSPDFPKGTPAKSSLKMTPSVPSSKKRPRTRALSKSKENSDLETKKSDGEKTGDNDDEDDIRAAFDDSFID